jgi:hypothetical protein
MKILNVKNHILKNISSEALQSYRDGAPFKHLRQDPIVRDHWISFTAVDWQAEEQCLYIGLTAFDCDLLWRFYPEGARFESLGFKEASDDPQSIKIHRGLTPDQKGGYYFGTACLQDLDERNHIRGGSIYHYQQGHFEFLGVPIPNDYIQNIEVDTSRRRVYGVTYPVMYFFDYHLDERKTLFSFFTGSHFHESGLDDNGYLWGTWATNRGHCLFRYHPDVCKPEFYNEPIPNLGSDHKFTFPMNGPIDSFINGRDGYLYFGTTLGELYRLNPNNGEMKLLGKPTQGIRLSGLTLGPDDMLLGSYGAYNQAGLFLYDRKKEQFINLGSMQNEEAECFMIHDIAWDGGSRVFAAETDNVDRSGYLWEVEIG